MYVIAYIGSQVSVAKSFDAPAKLLFPRAGDLVDGKQPFSMLGLGDIVIPGVFVALILRYDVLQKFKTKYFQRYCLNTSQTSVENKSCSPICM